jgi:hypothetical protein
MEREAGTDTISSVQRFKKASSIFFLVLFLFVIGCTVEETAFIPFTVPEGDIQVAFSVAADMRGYTGNNRDYFRNTCDQIAFGGRGDFMISPGDIDPPDGAYQTIQTFIGEDYTWYPVVGNHEAETQADMDWLRLFNWKGNSLPNVVNVGPAGSIETTYSFDYGDAHFIALNEYYDGSSDTGTDGDVVDSLYEWLVDDLTTNTAPIVFVFGHEPAYPQPDGENGRIRHAEDSLNLYTANMVLRPIYADTPTTTVLLRRTASGRSMLAMHGVSVIQEHRAHSSCST